ncbi:MAG: hypothetical protein GYA87_05070 [Christensenellaceae bacterium]|nr:hypothetical protein [Christensenellaceae bacterium]
MSKISVLWDYQVLDMEVVKLQRAIVNSPKLQKLKKDREFLLAQQDVIKKIEDDVLNMSDRVAAIKVAIEMLDEQLKSYQTRLENDVPQNQDEARNLCNEVRKIARDIADFEKEARQIQKKAKDRTKQEYDVRIRAARVKQEFNELKDEYQPEQEQQKKELEIKKQKVVEKAKEVDPDLLKKYESIKPHAMPPLARLLGQQCGGCNMALPSVTLRQFDEGEKYLECSNCGRIIVRMEDEK